MINSIKTFIEGLGMPYWGTVDEMKYERGVLTITYCDDYCIFIDKDSPCEDGATSNSSYWEKDDLLFAYNVLDNRNEILGQIGSDVEFFEADLRDYTDGGMYPAHIKRYGKEEEVIEVAILED